MNIIGYSVVNDYPNHQPPKNFSYYHLFSVYYCILLVPSLWRSVCLLLYTALPIQTPFEFSNNIFINWVYYYFYIIIVINNNFLKLNNYIWIKI